MTDEPRDEQQPSVEQNATTSEPSNRAAGAPSDQPDPNDEVPVPIVMSPAEVDERAQVVEALREEEGAPAPRDEADQEA